MSGRLRSTTRGLPDCAIVPHWNGYGARNVGTLALHVLELGRRRLHLLAEPLERLAALLRRGLQVDAGPLGDGPQELLAACEIPLVGHVSELELRRGGLRP